MGYNIDLKRVLITRYMKILRNQNLLPSRRILLNNLEDNFKAIMADGINNLAELKSGISTKNKLAVFAERTGISEDYLIILKREIGSLEQKPVPISDFPGISLKTISSLSDKGIKTSKDFYDSGSISNKFLELNSLCNLVRINGVGAIAARIIYESGYKSIDEIAGAKSAELLENMNTVNAEKQYYKANLGLKDMQFIIDAAKIILETED